MKTNIQVAGKESRINEGRMNKMEVDGNINSMLKGSYEVSKERLQEDRIKKFNNEANATPFYRDHPSRMKWMGRFADRIGHKEGFWSTAERTKSANIDSARGSFAELARAYRIDLMKSTEIKGIGKRIETPKGVTDIDIYFKKGDKNYWFENKDVRSGISNSKRFNRQINNMSDALKQGFAKDKYGNKLKVDKALYINKGPITDSAIKYAESKNVHIKEGFDSAALKAYLPRI